MGHPRASRAHLGWTFLLKCGNISKKVWEMMSLLTSNAMQITLCGDWVGAVIDILMFVLTGISVICAFRAYTHQKERSKKEAACNLAKHYANSLIDKYSDISSVFEASGINAEIKRLIEIDKLENFDSEEIHKILQSKNADGKDFVDKLLHIDPEAILNTKISSARSVFEREMISKSYLQKDDEGKYVIKNGRFLQTDFMQEIGALLNELEWFAMNCRYGLADEELLYQSLHQSYLSTVWMLSYFISVQNTNDAEKVFTNVIWLFNKWRARLHEITNEAKVQQDALIEKAKAIKPREFSGKALK